MFHQGYALKKYLKEHSSVNEIASVLGISRQAVHSLYGNEKFDEEYVEKLRKGKVKIAGITVMTDESNVVNHGNGGTDTPLESAQDKYIASLEETVRLQKEMIEILKEKLAAKK